MKQGLSTTGGPQVVTVDEDSAERRLDNFLLSLLKGVPRSRIYRIIRSGEVRVNKGRAKPTTRLKAGDQVRVPPVRMPERDGSGPDRRHADRLLERVVHEDERLLVIDKPAGMAVHGGSGVSFGAIELLRAAMPDEPFLELVHRLDRDTSGLLMVARRRSALRELHRQLREGEVHKQYLGLLTGELAKSVTVDRPLLVTHRQNGERHVVVAPEGKSAVTHFRVEESFTGYTLARVTIDTGRTHQIRVHAQSLGMPLAGDPRYGDPERTKDLSLRRLFLHAEELRFTHPGSGEELSLRAGLPAELETVIDSLR